jgi:trimeric autotransporter adhesin
VTNAKIAGGAVNSGKVADDSLTGADILESSLGKIPDADKLDGKDSTAFLAADAAAGGHLTGNYPSPLLRDGVVGTPQLTNFAVTENKIQTGAVTSSKIGVGAVGGFHIADRSVRAEDLVSLHGVTATVSVPDGGAPVTAIGTPPL